MKRIRGHKLCGTNVLCALLLAALFFGYLCPCHEYSGYDTGTVILGYDTCDDSPFLQVETGNPTRVPVGFYHLPKMGEAIPRIFAHSIFHPPQA